ncbi:MAG: hypothetical protein DDT42_01571 [candidate division WS2 bacterium]|uniref:Uncharacterized protein n=1 Tax=Psychracetigena formicireducens TaxID=2986056 RepID=A0A9E2BHJ2_PSYF1|nr:hypothetical protein [Candidatus Psychracetigena formicireducens]
MFRRFLKMEFQKTIYRWQTAVGFLVFFISFMLMATALKEEIAPWVGIMPQERVLQLTNPFISFVLVFGWGVGMYMFLVIPLVVLFIFGDSLLVDYKSGFYQFSLTRISYKSFIKNKILAVLSLAFLTMFIFQVFGFVFLLATSPFHFPAGDAGGRMPLDSSLFVSTPFTYVFILMTIISLVSTAYASLGLVGSSIFKNSPSIVGGGLLILLFSHIGGAIASVLVSDLYYLSPLMMSGPFLYDFPRHYGFTHVLAYWLIVITFFIYISYVAFNRKSGFRNFRVSKE